MGAEGTKEKNGSRLDGYDVSPISYTGNEIVTQESSSDQRAKLEKKFHKAAVNELTYF